MRKTVSRTSSCDSASGAASKRIAATCSKRSKPPAPTCRSISFRRSSPTTTHRKCRYSPNRLRRVGSPARARGDRRSPHRAGLTRGAVDRNGPRFRRQTANYGASARKRARAVGMTSSISSAPWLLRTTCCPAACCDRERFNPPSRFAPRRRAPRNFEPADLDRVAAAVRVGDVARVVDGAADRSATTRVDGTPAIVLFVSRAEKADALAQSARREPSNGSPQSIRSCALRRSDRGALHASGDRRRAANARRGNRADRLVMLFFLHAWRNALIAAISIPASLCAAFAAMWIAGFTIDVLSLMGLSLTIGSSSTIPSSSSKRSRATRSAADGDDAALAGRSELGGVAFAITLVDVAVFAPIAFMSGLVGAVHARVRLDDRLCDLVLAARFVHAHAAAGRALGARRARQPFAGGRRCRGCCARAPCVGSLHAWHGVSSMLSRRRNCASQRSTPFAGYQAAARRPRPIWFGAVAVTVLALVPQ